MHDVRGRIRDSRPDGTNLAPLDVDALVRRAGRRAVVHRTSAVVALAGLVVGGVAVLDTLRPPGGVAIEPADERQPTAGASSDAPETESRDPSEPAPQDGGDQVDDPGDLDQAIEWLIDANRDARPRPTPAEGQLLVDRSWGVHLAAAGGPDGPAHSLEVIRYELREDDAGQSTVVRHTLGTVEPSDSLADLRRDAGRFIADPPEAGEERHDDVGPVDEQAAMALEEAEAASHGSAEPAPGRTERPDQAHAFIRAADALRLGLAPNDRIRALEAIARIAPSLVEYRGRVQDLLGREGIAIAGRDGDGWDAPQWHVLIFDPETGDLLGEYQQIVDPDGEVPPIISYTARETLLVDTD